MTYTSQFKDYDNAQAFDTVLTALTPQGFNDSSWRNDTSPSISRGESVDDSDFIQIWIDYKDTAKREYNNAMFMVYKASEIMLETDNMRDAIAKALELSQ